MGAFPLLTQSDGELPNDPSLGDVGDQPLVAPLGVTAMQLNGVVTSRTNGNISINSTFRHSLQQ